MKLAVVVQRYGQAINGGAELHARYIAERLARHAEVDVITTCASDYVTWRNEARPAHEHINGIPVRRFPVAHERELLAFSRQSNRVFERRHSLEDELRWLDAEGPTSPALVSYIAANAESYDFCVFFSYRYYQAYHGARTAPTRAVLVPTAERDSAIGMALFQPLFRGVRALMYNSPEEQSMIHAVSGNYDVPAVVVGVGSEVPKKPQPERFRQKFGICEPFAIYVGRIDENKGCKELFDFFERYTRDAYGRLSLVLIGHSLLPMPEHPRIRHLGFLDEADKFDAMAAADLLVMPSYFESLSMVALEAWALGRPVLANGKCDVLKGQCVRSNAGLCYESYPEFLAVLQSLEKNRRLSMLLGENGRQFYREHYDWPVIERKYLDMFERLRKEPARSRMEPLPPRIARWRRNLPPAQEVVARLPRGTSAVQAEGTGCRCSRRTGVTRVHQVLATLGYGDAIGHEVLGIQRVLRAAGYDSEIFVEAADYRLESMTRDYRELIDVSHPDNLLLHHFSLASKASRTAYALPDRMALIYHNITPPEFFVGLHRSLSSECFRGRRELRAYAERCDLALGDSEFNRQDLEALGFRRTGVLPVVPDFSHLSGVADRTVADLFDDTWTNILFVGRMVPNKKLEDVIRFFHAYHTFHNPRSRLLLVGAHGGLERYTASLHQLTATLGNSHVHFVGPVSNEELVAFYEIADLFLCASEHEGFCVPVVEAFYKEIPVLAYAAAAVPATMDGAGVLYTEKDPSHVAGLMDAIVSNTEVQDTIVCGQLAAVERLQARDFAGTLLKLVDGILSSPRSRAPHVTFDFWYQFDAAEVLEELRLDRPSIYKALPER